MSLTLNVRLVLLSSLCCILLSGCAQEYERYTKKTDESDYGSIYAKREQEGKMITYGTTHTDDQHHVNTTVSYSNEISRAVASIKGVGDARVFLTDKNAYIALVLDTTGRGMVKSAPAAERDSSSQYSKTAPNTISENPFRSYMTVNDSSQLSDKFKHTVADTVKKLAPTVQEIHISANKDFMYYMDEYAQVAWGNRPLDPLIDHFNILVQHQFSGGKVMPQSLKYLQH